MNAGDVNAEINVAELAELIQNEIEKSGVTDLRVSVVLL